MDPAAKPTRSRDAPCQLLRRHDTAHNKDQAGPHRHLSLLHVTGHLAFAARQPQKLGVSPTTQQLLHNLVKLLCKQQWLQRNPLSATQAAGVLRALSHTGTYPDTMPGSADALAEQFSSCRL
ncbi:hypothetical protein ABBQ32_004995 [Trebouxia sp. C0010 RCD-2024]